MADIIIILLLIVLIFKDFVTIKVSPKEVEEKTEDRVKREELQREFDRVMSYTIEDAIESKRGE